MKTPACRYENRINTCTDPVAKHNPDTGYGVKGAESYRATEWIHTDLNQ
jgi:hypothetical protein